MKIVNQVEQEIDEHANGVPMEEQNIIEHLLAQPVMLQLPILQPFMNELEPVIQVVQVLPRIIPGPLPEAPADIIDVLSG